MLALLTITVAKPITTGKNSISYVARRQKVRVRLFKKKSKGLKQNPHIGIYYIPCFVTVHLQIYSVRFEVSGHFTFGTFTATGHKYYIVIARFIITTGSLAHTAI